MQQSEILKKINKFPRWHYEFDLKGIRTPVFDPNHVNRHKQRKKYFFDPLVKLYGNTLRGKRVLDLGCNAGFWSLQAIMSGAEYVLGIDGREMHIEQANFVFEVYEIEKRKYDFICDNIYDMDFSEFGTFDVVLCLGLMYHIIKPFVLLENISAINRDILVIDTSLSPLKGALLELRRDDLEEPRDAVDYALVTYPTKQAVIKIASQVGYSVVTLQPEFDDYTSAKDYRNGRRLAFLCSKKTDLGKLSTIGVKTISVQNELPLRQMSRTIFGVNFTLTASTSNKVLRDRIRRCWHFIRCLRLGSRRV